MPRTIAGVIRDGLATGRQTNDILAEVRSLFPESNTNANCVSYYRSLARRAGLSGQGITVPVRRDRRRTRLIALESAFNADNLTERAFGIEFEFERDRNRPEHGLRFFGEVVKQALAPWAATDTVFVRDSYGHSNGRTWDVKLDSSCEFELATPKLFKRDWPKVVAVLKALRAAGATVSQRCGMHIHHETRGMRAPHLKNLIRLWGAFDATLHEALPESRRNNRYAYRMSEDTARQLATMDARSIRREIRARDRYVALNMTNWWRRGTVEVRSHHGTLDADKTGYWLQITQAIVERAERGRIGRSLDGIVSAADRFRRFTRVVGEKAARTLARWTEERNPNYFAAMNAAA